MEVLAKHIALLLQDHDCVIIPRFGGFVAHEESALFQKEYHLFNPPKRVISFNSCLTHNDGLLVESYMRSYGIGYKDALLRVEQDTDALILSLKNNRSVSLDNIGLIRLNTLGDSEFFPSESELLNASFYRLPQTKILPLSELNNNETALGKSKTLYHDRDMVYIPISKRGIKHFASAVAIIAVILCISFPTGNNINPELLKAGFLSDLQKNTVSNFIEVPATSPIIHEQDRVTSIIPPTPAETKKEVSAKSVIVSTSNTVQKRNRNYYIIVGSYPSQKLAVQDLKKLHDRGYSSAGILQSGERIRLYSAQYANKADAEKMLPLFKEQLNRDDAWIFSSK